MKKVFLFMSLALAFNFYGCNNDSSFIDEDITIPNSRSVVAVGDSFLTDYYWYEGKKVYLKRNETKQYVTYLSENCNQIQKIVNENGYKGTLKKSNVVNYACITSLTKERTAEQNINWGIIESTDAKIIEEYDSNQILYQSPFYTIDSIGREVGISHLFYVKLKAKSDEDLLIDMAEKCGVEVIGYNQHLPLWYTLSCTNESKGNALQMANLFYESGCFQISEPNFMTEWDNTSTASINDTYYNKQWNLYDTYSINWELANSLSTGSGVKVAVIDSGIEALHPDMANVYQTYDSYTNSHYTAGIYGPHGTECAGIIGATANNNEGIVGIAPNVKLYSYSVYIRNAPNVDQELATSVSLAANSVDVISCSWGSNGVPSSLIKDAIKYNVSWGRNGKGSVIVFAAGNENSNIDYPANCGETLISVGAINKNGTRANFSNYGLELDVVAPGVSIPTCDLLGSSGVNNTNYSLDFNGTSAACPHVAAVAALMLSVNPNLTSSEVEQIITQTARKVGGYNYSLVTGKNNGTWHQEMGYGLVNAYAAVQEAINRNN